MAIYGRMCGWTWLARTCARATASPSPRTSARGLVRRRHGPVRGAVRRPDGAGPRGAGQGGEEGSHPGRTEHL